MIMLNPLSLPRKLFRRHPVPAALICVLTLFFTLWGFWWEPRQLVTVRQTLALPGWPAGAGPLRVALISDLHAGGPFVKPEKIREIVTRINAENPDLVLIAGDFISESLYGHRGIIGVVGGHYLDPEKIAEPLAALHPRYGVFAVLGNHDWHYRPDKLTAALAVNHVTVLENRAVALPGGLWLAGIGDLFAGRNDLALAFKEIPPGAKVIALMHNPDLFPQLPASAILGIAGHTHGGQVSLPFIGPPFTSSRYGQRYVHGHIVENGRDFFVTSGIGETGLPVRFRVPPEIVILTLGGDPSR